MTENEEGLKTEPNSAPLIDRVSVAKLKLIGSRMGYERVYYCEGEYTIVTGIGNNGFSVSAYPHRHVSARLVRSAPRYNHRHHNVLGGQMKLTNEELDALLAKAGLRLDQEYSPRCSYRKTEWLRTACLACGTQADYRLAYILGKNADGEKVCRACYWRDWYRGEEDIHYANGMSLVEAKQRLVAAGLEEAPVDMSEAEARMLARENGYELVELLQGARPGEQLLVVRCASCGRQTVERVGDVSFGCTCAKSKK